MIEHFKKKGGVGFPIFYPPSTPSSPSSHHFSLPFPSLLILFLVRSFSSSSSPPPPTGGLIQKKTTYPVMVRVTIKWSNGRKEEGNRVDGIVKLTSGLQRERKKKRNSAQLYFRFRIQINFIGRLKAGICHFHFFRLSIKW